MAIAKDIGIDLGTASVLVYVKGKGVVLNEPSVVAMDKTTGKLLKVGTDAQAMLGRTPGNIIAIRPLREGVISDYDMTERMLKEFIHKVAGFSFFKPRVIICVPSGITEVEERAVIDAGIQAGARKVYLIEEPVAAAIGAGIDITQPDGHMVVDIGGGTADIAVISLSGVVESASIKIAGDQLNEAVVKYMRRKHNLLVGERTAEEMKKQIGCVFPKDEEETMDVKGRCLLTGLPKVVTVSSTEMMDAFEEPVERIMEADGILVPPPLRFDVLEEVSKRLPGFPIVLHGSSSVPQEYVKMVNEFGGQMPNAIGVPEDQLRQAAKLSVCKINIDSDLRLAMTGTIRKFMAEHPDKFDPREYLKPARANIKELVRHKLVDVLGCAGKA